MKEFPKIPGYTIDYPLGEGGMATVYRGTQHKLNRTVAIKILDPLLLKKETIAARFMKEAETAANLYHSNIVSIFDVGKINNFHYIIMEYLEHSLKDRMQRDPNHKLYPGEAFNIIKKIAGALDYAHSEGIIHRDIKPDNIMFRRDGTPVLVDFGIARAVSASDGMTRTGMSIGTPHYMSPEQCKADPIDGRSDFYSLGVVLFELLSGSKPFEAETTIAVALKHIQNPIPPLPPELIQYQMILEKMMAKDPKERIQNGKQLADLIDAAFLQPVSTPPAAKPEPQSVPASAESTGSQQKKKDDIDSMFDMALIGGMTDGDNVGDKRAGEEGAGEKTPDNDAKGKEGTPSLPSMSSLNSHEKDEFNLVDNILADNIPANATASTPSSETMQHPAELLNREQQMADGVGDNIFIDKVAESSLKTGSKEDEITGKSTGEVSHERPDSITVSMEQALTGEVPAPSIDTTNGPAVEEIKDDSFQLPLIELDEEQHPVEEQTGSTGPYLKQSSDGSIGGLFGRFVGLIKGFLRQPVKAATSRQIASAVVLGILLIVIFVFFFFQGISTGSSDDGDSRSSAETVATDNQSQVSGGSNQETAGGAGTAELSPEQLQDAEFQKHVDSAAALFQQEKFTEAKDEILAASQIKTTPQLEELQTKINLALEKNKKATGKGQTIKTKRVGMSKKTSGTAPVSEKDAYENAIATNTVETYKKYLEQYPTSGHIDDIITRMDQLKEKAALGNLNSTPKRRYKLRSQYQILDYESVEKMVKVFGFFENSFNKSGTFKNNFESTASDGDIVIIDHETGLMWHPKGSPKSAKFSKARRWIQTLNREQYGGYSNWRFPTLEEASSLLDSSKNRSGLFTHPFFDGTQKRIWTGDLFGTTKRWVVRFNNGIVYAYSDRSRQYVRPVRSTR